MVSGLNGAVAKLNARREAIPSRSRRARDAVRV
jgi:hypothetical protein